MQALAEEKNLIDILTQNGRYYEGMDLWKYSILFNWHSCSMLIHCNFVESINQVFRIDLKYFQRTQLIVAMGKAQSKTKLSEEDIIFLEENTTMNRAKIMVTYEHKVIWYQSYRGVEYYYIRLYAFYCIYPLLRNGTMAS